MDGIAGLPGQNGRQSGIFNRHSGAGIRAAGRHCNELNRISGQIGVPCIGHARTAASPVIRQSSQPIDLEQFVGFERFWQKSAQ